MVHVVSNEYPIGALEAPAPESLAFRNILCTVDLGPQSRTAQSPNPRGPPPSLLRRIA